MLQQQPRNTLNTRKRKWRIFPCLPPRISSIPRLLLPFRSRLCQAVPRQVFRGLIPPTAAAPREYGIPKHRRTAPSVLRPLSSVLCPLSFPSLHSPLSSLRPPSPVPAGRPKIAHDFN